jgi:hypothetical protein
MYKYNRIGFTQWKLETASTLDDIIYAFLILRMTVFVRCKVLFGESNECRTGV